MDLTRFWVLTYVAFLVLAGYYLPHQKPKVFVRIFGWLTAVATVFIAVSISAHEPAVIRMITIVCLLLLSMKLLVAIESYQDGNKLLFFQWIAFAIGWFGMRPVLFQQLPSSSLSYYNLVLKAGSRILLGFVLLHLSVITERYDLLNSLFLSQLLLLAGISFIFHFGALNLSVAWWRACGVNTQELFKAPYRSTSLKEFWGRRWNVAFSEMTQVIAYRPLKSRIGSRTAVTLSFLLSGLLHEIAISLPVKSGYGLPMVYFGIHALAMQLEARSQLVQKLIRDKILSHVWVIAWLVIPMPLLFHSEFLFRVIVPLRSFLLYELW